VRRVSGDTSATSPARSLRRTTLGRFDEAQRMTEEAEALAGAGDVDAQAHRAPGEPHPLIAAASHISSGRLPPLRNGKRAHQRNRTLLSIASNMAKNAAVSGESLLVRAQASSVLLPTGITAIRRLRSG
jgi:hypothetical protein